MLTSLEITNFRTFAHLRIERLGQVNLILGKNNVGKTTLLEALRVYASRWPAHTVKDILSSHDQVLEALEKSFFELESLFHIGGVAREQSAAIGPLGNGNGKESELTVRMALEIVEGARNRNEAFFEEPISALSIKSGDHHFRLFADGNIVFSHSSGKPIESLPFDSTPPFLRETLGRSADVDTARRWDFIALTAGEAGVLEAAKTIAPIRAIAFVADPRSKEGDRIAKVRLEGLANPVPLGSLGDGVKRVIQIALAIQYSAFAAKAARNSCLPENVFFPVLIDEIETGIHHTRQADMWRFVLKASSETGVQVFATTHSWDCLKGFAEAVRDVADCEAFAIRLEQASSRQRTGAIVLDRQELPIVVRESIEVR